MKRTREPYRAPHRYTEEELRALRILDLESDLAFSLRTDPNTPEWEAYRNGVQTEIEHLRGGGEDPLCRRVL